MAFGRYQWIEAEKTCLCGGEYFDNVDTLTGEIVQTIQINCYCDKEQ